MRDQRHDNEGDRDDLEREGDDYLWDRSGAPDDVVRRLEQTLAPARFDGRAAPAMPATRRAPWRWLVPALTAAAVAGGVALWWSRTPAAPVAGGGPAAPSPSARPDGPRPDGPRPDGPRPDAPSWGVETVAGQPACGDNARGGGGRPVACVAWRVGEWLETDATARARVAVADIGHMDIEPGSRLRLVATGEDQHRLELARGVVHASVFAPPRLLIVDTPAAAAVDLGCAYTLSVDADGATRLEVTSGWVALETPGRATFVPAGARARSWPGRGPGLPLFTDAPAALVTAAERLGEVPGDAPALTTALGAARPRDTLTLWHLIARVDEGPPRKRVMDRIEALGVGPPVGVSRAAIMALDAEALEAWRGALSMHW